MKVLDATFLIDYLDCVDATAENLLAREDERFILPAPAYAEALVGEGTKPDGDVAEAKAELSWGAVYETGESKAAVGLELDAPVISTDGDLTDEETKEVVDVEEYCD